MIPDRKKSKTDFKQITDGEKSNEALGIPAKNALNLDGLFSVDKAIMTAVTKHLDIKSLMSLSKVSKVSNVAAKVGLYEGLATKQSFPTKVKLSQKKDTKEADKLFEEVRRAVNAAYKMLMEYLQGGTLDANKYGISKERWDDFITKLSNYKLYTQFKDDVYLQAEDLRNEGYSEKEINKFITVEKGKYKEAHGGTMNPSTAAGYIVEDIATHILKHWSSEYKFQDTEVMGPATRPDVTAKSKENDEQILMDITSIKSAGHILKKVKDRKEEETDWLRFPHVAELLYPKVNFKDPNNMNSVMSVEDSAAILRRVVEAETNREMIKYKKYIDDREKYYKDRQTNLKNYRNKTRGKHSDRQLDFLNNHEGIEAEYNSTDKKLSGKVLSFSSVKTTGYYDRGIFAPPSPAHYSFSDNMDEEIETEKRKYPNIENFGKSAYDHVTKKYKKNDEK